MVSPISNFGGLRLGVSVRSSWKARKFVSRVLVGSTFRGPWTVLGVRPTVAPFPRYTWI